MALLVGSAVAADPPQRLVGHSKSGGAEDLTIALTAVDGDRQIVEVYWPKFEKTTLEQAVSTSVAACDSADLADGRARLDRVDRCFDQRIDDRHPTHDYVDKTKVRCALGSKDGAPAAACKLQYSGWFTLVAPSVHPVVSEPAAPEPAPSER